MASVASTSLAEKENSPLQTAAMVAAIRAEADAPSPSYFSTSTTAAAPAVGAATSPTSSHLLQPTTSLIIAGDCNHNGNLHNNNNIPHASSSSSSFTALLAQLVPPGGIRSSIFNLAGASIGAGILGLPAASNDAGMLLSFILLLVITIFSVYSMYLLAVAAENTHIHSFEQMGKIVPILDVFRGKGKKNSSTSSSSRFDFSHVVAGIRFFHSYSGCVAYVISVNDCLSAILRPPENGTAAAAGSHYKAYAVCGTVAIWLFCMLPLVLPKHIDSLRYASTVAVCFMVYFVMVVVIHSCAHGLGENIRHVKLVGAHTRDSDSNKNNNNNGDVNWVYLFRSGNPVIQSVGVFTFAYCCQINAFEVFWDLDHKIRKKRNHRNYTWAAFYAMLLCFVLYCGVIFFCYLDFGSQHLENASILLLYAPMQEGKYYYVLIAYIGVLVKLCVAYALLTSAARNSLYYLLGYQTKYHPVATTATTAIAEEEGERGGGNEPGGSCKNEAQQQQQQHSHHGKEVTYIDHIPTPKHRKVVLVLSVCTLLSGLSIPHINVVFGFAGSLSGSCIAFIFPALFYYYSFDYYNYYKPSRAQRPTARDARQREAEEGVRKLVHTGLVEDMSSFSLQQQQQQRESGSGPASGEAREEGDVEGDDDKRENASAHLHSHSHPSSSSSTSCDTTEEDDDNEETILSGPPLCPPSATAPIFSPMDGQPTASKDILITDCAARDTAAGGVAPLQFGNTSRKRIPFVHVVGLLVLLVSGWIAMVWGTAGTIYNTALGI